MSDRNTKGVRSTLTTSAGTVGYYPLAAVSEHVAIGLDHLPFTIKLLLENVVRQAGAAPFTWDDVETVAAWQPGQPTRGEFAFLPARVLTQDFTGIPVLVDFAAMREAVRKLGGDPKRVNPIIPSDLIIDHSVQVDVFGGPDSFARNVEIEYDRNRERYMFLRWAQGAFENLRIVPPGTGICHQVNLEYLGQVVATRTLRDGTTVALPDTLVGTDSHTTMINGLGILGIGVGGIEAEAMLLGQPMYLSRPEVVGIRLIGKLPHGVTATDLVLTVTQVLRQFGVVGKFVEFFGPSVGTLSLPNRATISNMCPEYGATTAMFPIDNETLAYLRMTGRSQAHINLVEAYARTQGMFHTTTATEPLFDAVVELDLASVEPSVAGPRRPQDRVPLPAIGSAFRTAFAERLAGGGSTGGVAVAERPPALQTRKGEVGHGSVVIAALTSCTNTSNPDVMIAAGLVAKKAVERGLSVHPSVKTSLAPGSAVVTAYLQKAGLTRYLDALGFNTVGYGCTTCIGNSGPLPQPVADAIQSNDLVTVAVLSGNRNFEGRIHPQVRASFLASPPLVVAFALAGTVNIDLTKDPLGEDRAGNPVYLRDIWPTDDEIRTEVGRSVSPTMFAERYRDVFHGDETWRTLPVPQSEIYRWDANSTYVQCPPFFEGMTKTPAAPADIRGARVLVWVGDSVTTDHISPAGAISKDTPAWQYLTAHGVKPSDFNTYGARRGNHEVLMRGTFANVRLRNRLGGGREGGWTTYFPTGEVTRIYDAAMRYLSDGTPLVVLAGAEYGTGSSRDWAAKGPLLLGVRAVIAQSFERIHRSNLVGMGILPLQFEPRVTAETLGFNGTESFDIGGVGAGLKPLQKLTVRAVRPDGFDRTFQVIVRIDVPIEVDYYRHGGVLPYMARKLAQA